MGEHQRRVSQTCDEFLDTILSLVGRIRTRDHLDLALRDFRLRLNHFDSRHGSDLDLPLIIRNCFLGELECLLMHPDVFALIHQIPVQLLGRRDQVDRLYFEVDLRHRLIVLSDADQMPVDVAAMVLKQRLIDRISDIAGIRRVERIERAVGRIAVHAEADIHLRARLQCLPITDGVAMNQLAQRTRAQ